MQSELKPLQFESANDYMYLLTQYVGTVKYAQAWLDLKCKGEASIPLEPNIINPVKRITGSLHSIRKKDLAYAEFCKLHYGEPMVIVTEYTDTHVHARMVKASEVNKAIGQNRKKRLDKLKGKQNIISQFD